jgi:RNA polymerase sigma-70 factor (ECF subfamily)
MPSEPQKGNSPQDAPNDWDLVRRSQAGDSSAFNELVTGYWNRVFTSIYGIVQNEQDALDLAQEAFFNAWHSIHQFKGQSSFFTWLYRIAINETIKALRRKRIHKEADFNDRIESHVDPGSRTTPWAAPLPAKKVEQDEIRKRVNEALAKLSPEHRTVVVMKELEGLQYNEIAEILDCSIGTVMSRLFYARKKLQNFLRDVHENLEE